MFFVKFFLFSVKQKGRGAAAPLPCLVSADILPLRFTLQDGLQHSAAAKAHNKKARTERVRAFA